MMSSQVRAMLRNYISADVLTDTCMIERQLQVTGTYGEEVAAWEVVSMSVDCRIVMVGQQSRGMIVEASEQESMMELYKLTVPHGTELDNNYRVTINEIVYYVVQVELALTDEMFNQAIITRRR